MNSGLVPFYCVVKEHSVYLHKLKIFDSKAYDMSSQSTFDLSNKYNSYEFKFWNTISKPYVKIPGNKALSSGFFQLDFI